MSNTTKEENQTEALLVPIPLSEVPDDQDSSISAWPELSTLESIEKQILEIKELCFFTESANQFFVRLLQTPLFPLVRNLVSFDRASGKYLYLKVDYHVFQLLMYTRCTPCTRIHRGW
jgi:hypothetical protein